MMPSLLQCEYTIVGICMKYGQWMEDIKSIVGVGSHIFHVDQELDIESPCVLRKRGKLYHGHHCKYIHEANFFLITPSDE